MKTTAPKVDIGSTVYHVQALDKEPGLVVGRYEGIDGTIRWDVVWPDRETCMHLPQELSLEYTPHYGDD